MIPRLPWPDDALRFARDGYLFGSRGFRTVEADAFRTRLLGIPVVILRGQAAARFFYEGGRFDRRMSLPPSVVHLLQDRRSVQTLEGPRHADRKALFLDLLQDEDRRSSLRQALRESWAETAARHAGRTVAMLDVSAEALHGAAVSWTGIPSEGAEALTAQEFLSMIDNAGRFGPPNWIARLRRISTERTVRALITAARSRPADDTPLSRVAHYRDADGLLPVGVAAVELINVLRPIVAVSHFIVFAALALHDRPERRADLVASESSRHAFAQEVRRFFPFFPVVAGRARRDLEWEGETIAERSLVLLDLYGTDHREATWEHPGRFDPDRFVGGTAHPAIVAQGAGDPLAGHHCPGESATVDLIDEALHLMAAEAAPYTVPAQDLRISLRRFPARPEDGFRIRF